MALLAVNGCGARQPTAGCPHIINIDQDKVLPVEYWRDVTLGVVDISGSRIFGWVEVDIPRSRAGGIPREGLIDAAVSAVQNAGGNPLQGFHRPIAVFTHDWSRDDPNRPAGIPNWTANDPLKPCSKCNSRTSTGRFSR